MKQRKNYCAKAGVTLLIALAMVCSAFVITGEPAFAKAAKPGKIKESTVKRVSASESSMTISYGKSAKAAKYQVRYKTNGAKKWKSKTTKKQKITLKGLKKYTKYNVQVRGLKGKKKGAWTKAVTFTTLGDPHMVFLDPGDEATLPGDQSVKQVRAGDKIGDLPMPTITLDGAEIKGWFVRWFTEPEGQGEEVTYSTIMGDKDMTIYGVCSFDGNGDSATFFNIIAPKDYYMYTQGDVEQGLKELNEMVNVKFAYAVVAGAHKCNFGVMTFRNDLKLEFRKSWNNKEVTELQGERNEFFGLEEFLADHVDFLCKLGVHGAKKVTVTNCKIGKDLVIDGSDSQDLEEVKLENIKSSGSLFIKGKPGKKVKLTMNNCQFEGGVDLEYVTTDTIDKLYTTAFGLKLVNTDIKTLKRSELFSMDNTDVFSGVPLDMEGSKINLIDLCDIRARYGQGSKDAILVNPNPEIESGKFVIENIRNSFIFGMNGVRLVGQDFGISKIENTTVLATSGAAISLEKGEKGQPTLGAVLGESILYSRTGPVLNLEKGSVVFDGYLIRGAVGKVRAYGAAGLYAAGTEGTFVPERPVNELRNDDPQYSTVKEDTRVKECLETFEGKAFYYMINTEK